MRHFRSANLPWHATWFGVVLFVLGVPVAAGLWLGQEREHLAAERQSLAQERQRLALDRQRWLDSELLLLMELPHPVERYTCLLMRALLKRRANARLHRSDGWTVVMLAASSPDPPLVREALDRGADVNAVSNWGFTPLMMSSSEEVTRLLLKRGAHVNARSKEGVTALEMSYGRPSITRVLRRAGATDDGRALVGF